MSPQPCLCYSAKPYRRAPGRMPARLHPGKPSEPRSARPSSPRSQRGTSSRLRINCTSSLIGSAKEAAPARAAAQKRAARQEIQVLLLAQRAHFHAGCGTAGPRSRRPPRPLPRAARKTNRRCRTRTDRSGRATATRPQTARLPPAPRNNPPAASERNRRPRLQRQQPGIKQQRLVAHHQPVLQSPRAQPDQRHQVLRQPVFARPARMPPPTGASPRPGRTARSSGG